MNKKNLTEKEIEDRIKETTSINKSNIDLLVANTYTGCANMRKDEYLRSLGLDPKKYKNIPEMQLLRTLSFNAKVEKANALIDLNTNLGLLITYLKMVDIQQKEKENEEK